MKKTIVFTKQAQAFLDSIPASAQNNLRACFARLEEDGFLRSPFGEKVEGQRGLFEIRAKDAAGQYRVFYAYATEAYVVLLSGFVKKTQKTPTAEIQKALRIKKEIGL